MFGNRKLKEEVEKLNSQVKSLQTLLCDIDSFDKRELVNPPKKVWSYGPNTVYMLLFKDRTWKQYHDYEFLHIGDYAFIYKKGEK